jgi:hypothetical protein
MTGGWGGKRRGSSRPMGSKNIRYKTSAELIEAARIDERLIPVKFERTDSLEFLRATMKGEIWLTREQIYAARSVSLIEYSPTITLNGCSEARQAYFDGELSGVYPDGITSLGMIQAASDAGNAAGLVSTPLVDDLFNRIIAAGPV